ncbi:MAG TPA: sodium:proton antiporter [Verrucomicrobiae bacterium]|jgi:Na+/H+ antiporter NhaD/arsenite permease-like protein
MALPFGLLLACMAVLPLRWPVWWEKNYAKLVLLLAAATTGYYVFVLPAAALATVRHTGLDFAGFIALIGSLYVVSGGIHIHADGNGRASWNTLFLALAGLASNVLGTTGASMLLIRPWLNIHRNRPAPYQVVFFIFVVSNAGGVLTPMGNPPLLIGFLEGVPFWWVARHCWPMWLFSMAFLLAVFYAVDRRHEVRLPLPIPRTEHRCLSFGWWNLLSLAVIAAAAAITMPPLVRDGIMIAAAAASWFLTGRRAREANEFSFRPLIEVGILFFGVFSTMMPAIDLLRNLGGTFTPGKIYWSAGMLSAFLDSAPAYLAFFSAAAGHGGHELPARLISALSMGTVMFGAVTYIGNAPNLMVKSIADHRGAPAPDFLAYLFKWAVPVMLPLLMLQWLIFFR